LQNFQQETNNATSIFLIMPQNAIEDSFAMRIGL